MDEAKVGVVMGSVSDWQTLHHAAQTLETLSIPYETRVISAHRDSASVVSVCRGSEESGASGCDSGGRRGSAFTGNGGGPDHGAGVGGTGVEFWISGIG